LISNFSACWAFTAQQEGGYTSDPSDAGNWTGGACGIGTCNGTNFGISAAAYPSINIKALTATEAGVIMKANYWDKVSGDDLPPGVDCVTFDSVVNQGPGFAAKTLQTVVGADQDGDIGPDTLKAVAAMPAPSVIKAFTAARIAAYQADAGFADFGEDWTRRANDCQAAALAMVA
jgi:lysozyme family protein